MTAPLFTVVCGTLLRPSYASLVASLRRQTFRDWELVARAEPDVVLPISQNRAAGTARGRWLVFRDDDVVLPPDHLQKLADAIVRNPEAVGINGPCLMGDGVGHRRPWGFAWAGMGANLSVRRDAFLEVGGFEAHEDLGKVAHGWRQDTWLWWALDERFPGRTIWDETVVVEHPSNPGGWFVPVVEGRFFQRWRGRYFEHLIPMDGVCQEFLLTTQDLTAEETRRVLDARRELRKTQPGITVLPQEATA